MAKTAHKRTSVASRAARHAAADDVETIETPVATPKRAAAPPKPRKVRAEWILMDYFTFIVHVFTPQTRAFYGLERLWGDAERIDVTEEQARRA